MYKKGYIPWNKGKKDIYSQETRSKISRTLKLKYADGMVAGFQVGHPCYSYNLKEWNKAHPTWNKGIKGESSHSFNRKFSEVRKKKIAEKLKGNKNSLGYKHTEESKKKIGDSHRGENSVNWNPDREAMKRNKRNDPEYIQWRKKVLRRDGNICMLKNTDCSKQKNVHHILRWAKYIELRYEIDNGITLCQFHHPRKRNEEQRLIPILKQLIGSK